MNYVLNKLKNGLRVIVIPMPQLESATVALWVATGSRFEDKKVNGISHFLEHMVFKGSKKRPSAKLIAEAVDAIGGEFNAGTSKDWTNFYIKTRKGHLKTAFDVISDMVLSPLLKEEEIEREKGVIIQEIGMYEDTPLLKIGDVFEELAFDGNPLSWDISGTSQTVRAIKRDDFLRYRGIHYVCKNMLLTVAGGVTEKEVVKLAREYFGDLGGGPTAADPGRKLFKNGQKKPQVKLHPKKKEQAHLILGFMGDPRGYQGRFAQGILGAILGGGMSSRLFTEVRERRGLAYNVRTGVERYSDIGYMDSYAGVDVKKVDEAILTILNEHYALRDKLKPVTPKEFTIAKEYLKGHLALALEDTREIDSFFAEQELFLGKILTPEEVYKKIDEVSVEEVYEEAKRLFKPEKLNLAIIGPYKDKVRFQKLLK